MATRSKGRVPGTPGRPVAPSGQVLVYTTPTCPWCTRVKGYLRDQHVAFKELDVAHNAKAASRLASRTGQMGVPVVERAGRFVVGFDRGRLDELLGLEPRKRRLFGFGRT